jgi:hypothetical protein
MQCVCSLTFWVCAGEQVACVLGFNAKWVARQAGLGRHIERYRLGNTGGSSCIRLRKRSGLHGMFSDNWSPGEKICTSANEVVPRQCKGRAILGSKVGIFGGSRAGNGGQGKSHAPNPGLILIGQGDNVKFGSTVEVATDNSVVGQIQDDFVSVGID